MANKLRELLEFTAGRGGLQYSIALDDLRSYLRMASEVRIIEQILEIENPVLLRILVAAGMRKRIYKAYIDHIRELAGRGL